jgi:hypothetical protein
MTEEPRGCTWLKKQMVQPPALAALEFTVSIASPLARGLNGTNRETPFSKTSDRRNQFA